MEVNALNTEIGAILSQRQGTPPKFYPCAFYSCKLNPAEQNYDIGNRELLAMKAAFEEWRHWLEGAKDPFLVLTDHRILEYLHSAKRLNPRQARWALFFIRFHFIITYRPGTKNIKADSLSHQHDADTQNSTLEPIISTSLIIAPVHWDIMTEITQAHNQDPPPPSKSSPNLSYVPGNLRNRVIQWVHTSPCSGHPWYHSNSAATKEQILVEHVAGRHHRLHQELSNMRNS